jgi:GLPGLI family protein
MKHALRILSLLSAFLLILNAYAQDKKFEGTIVYSITIEGMENLPPEAAGMMKNMEMTYSIKNEHFRMDTKTMMSNTIVISDSKKQTAFTLMDMMGSKFMIRVKPEDIKKEADAPAPKITLLNETKVIAGYTCKKASITMNLDPGADKGTGEITTIVYYTDKIANISAYGTKFKGLTGFPLEYSIDASGMKMKMTATSIIREKIEESKFTMPPGYKETTAEEIQGELMKNMTGQ